MKWIKKMLFLILPFITFFNITNADIINVKKLEDENIKILSINPDPSKKIDTLFYGFSFEYQILNPIDTINNIIIKLSSKKQNKTYSLNKNEINLEKINNIYKANIKDSLYLLRGDSITISILFINKTNFIIKEDNFIYKTILPTPNLFIKITNILSIVAIPLFIFIVIIVGLYKKLKVYELFIEGAKDGFTIAIKIIPYLVAILVAISMFRASGALDYFTKLISPLTNLVGYPPEAIPMAIMRPLSGGGAQGIMAEILKTHGPDSFIGLLVSTMFGSTETTFYVLAVYFGAISIRKTRHAVISGLIGDFVGLTAAFIICKLVF